VSGSTPYGPRYAGQLAALGWIAVCLSRFANDDFPKLQSLDLAHARICTWKLPENLKPDSLKRAKFMGDFIELKLRRSLVGLDSYYQLVLPLVIQ
jgi:hypothetical protein